MTSLTQIQRTASYKDTPSSRLSNIQVKAYKPPGERASSGGASGRRGNNKNKANNARPSEPKKSKLWYETYACGDMTREDIKRQESIHELCQGETEMLSDLTLAKQVQQQHIISDDVVVVAFVIFRVSLRIFIQMNLFVFNFFA